MKALVLAGLLLLVCSAVRGDETEAADKTPLGDTKDYNKSSSSNAVAHEENADNNQVTTIHEIEKINDTGTDNDTAPSTPLISLPTSKPSTLTSPETALNETTHIYNTSTASSNATVSVPTPEESDNNDTRSQTTGTVGSGGTTKRPQQASKSFFGLYIILPIVAAAVAVMFVLCVVMMYMHKDRICRKKEREVKRVPEPEIVDCDQDLYSTVNYRHHGARAENRALSQDKKLMTKMESEDECLMDNSLDLDEKMESGRYVSPEGLVYVTLSQTLEEGNQKPAPKKRQKKKKNQEKNDSQYATLDFDKTGKLILKTEENKSKKEKKTKKKNKI